MSDFKKIVECRMSIGLLSVHWYSISLFSEQWFPVSIRLFTFHSIRLGKFWNSIRQKVQSTFFANGRKPAVLTSLESSRLPAKIQSSVMCRNCFSFQWWRDLSELNYPHLCSENFIHTFLCLCDKITIQQRIHLKLWMYELGIMIMPLSSAADSYLLV